MGGRFWIVLVASLVGIALAVMIGFLVFGAAIEAWGFLGAMVLLSAVLLVFGWVYDRRRAGTRDLPDI